MPARSQPYITVVVAARNDNHGGDMLRRMQACLDSWMQQAARYNLASEIVVIEWNPPADRPPLHTALALPQNGEGPCAIRFMEVSRELHQAIPYAQAIPFHQMIAKNVGIRRAAGDFVLCTNIDILFSAELIQYFAERRLDPNAFYRMDRWDIARDIPSPATAEDVLAFAWKNLKRVCAREGTWDSMPDGARPIEAADILTADSGIRLGRGWYSVESGDGMPKRSPGPEAEIFFERPHAGCQIGFDLESGPSAPPGGIAWEALDSSGNRLGSAVIQGRGRLRLTIPRHINDGRIVLRLPEPGIALSEDVRLLELRVYSLHRDLGPSADAWSFGFTRTAPPRDWTGGIPSPSPYAPAMRRPIYLHTNGCGDFTMMSRKAWFDLRGYPEFPVWPTHLDALTCYSAYHAGLKEVILDTPMRIFHIEHQAVWTPETESERETRADSRGVPLVGYASFIEHCHWMRRFNAPLVYCNGDWGMGSRNLPETAF